MKPLSEIAERLGLSKTDWEAWGPGRAKVTLDAATRAPTQGSGRLILVSAMNPTRFGAGKTTTSIGLAQGLAQRGERSVVCLREPSLGPIFGRKGGAVGGGASRVHPANAINMHFTGDLHAITSAHNLLAAMVDNHLHFRGSPAVPPGRVTWPRVLDMCDRALRQTVVGLGAKNGPVRESGFQITAASEVMGVLCLATSSEDLRARLSRMVVGTSVDGAPVTADDVGAVGSMMALLSDAIRPNLVQTTEGVPALIHGGPFANISFGCNSVMATKTGLAHADWVVTEAGFGFDLGGEKFFSIKCRSAGLDPSAVVIVATIRALRHHGGGPGDTPDAEAVQRGFANLARHIESVRAFGKPAVVALNRFPQDTDDEIAVLRSGCAELETPFTVADPFNSGGPGCVELADHVRSLAEQGATPHTPLYALDAPVREKVKRVATTIYGARDVAFTPAAQADLARIERRGLSGLPVCMAKTDASLSDDPKRLGRPTDFDITVRRIQPAVGAGYLVALLGDIVRMPGLAKRPNAFDIDVIDGAVTGV